MIAIYFTDKVDLITTAKDKFGAIVSTTIQLDVPARVKNENRVLFDASGKEIIASMKIFLSKNTVVTINMKVRIKKICDTIIPQPSQEWPIKSLELKHNFLESHYEVLL